MELRDTFHNPESSVVLTAKHMDTNRTYAKRNQYAENVHKSMRPGTAPAKR